MNIVLMNLYCTENELVKGFPEDVMSSITGDPFLYFEGVVQKIRGNAHVKYLEVIQFGDSMATKIWDVQTGKEVDYIEDEESYLKFVFDEGAIDV